MSPTSDAAPDAASAARPLRAAAAPAESAETVASGAAAARAGGGGLLFLGAAVVWLALDLASKAVLFAALHAPADAGPGGPYGEPVWVLDGFFRLSAHVNSGAAFGLGRGTPWAIVAMAGVFIPGIAWMAWHERKNGAPRWVPGALGLVTGGAVGNLFDRLAGTGVRDFFELVKPWSPDETLWPVFNVADVGIVGGMAAYFLWAAFGAKRNG